MPPYLVRVRNNRGAAMTFLADSIGLIAAMAISALFVFVLLDDLDPAWANTPMRARLMSLKWLGLAALALWVLAILGGMGWPAQLLAWVAGWIGGWINGAVAIIGAGVLAGGAAWAMQKRGAGLRPGVIGAQLGYVAMLAGAGLVQAGIGSH
jgi:hypothetical protein